MTERADHLPPRVRIIAFMELDFRYPRSLRKISTAMRLPMQYWWHARLRFVRGPPRRNTSRAMTSSRPTRQASLPARPLPACPHVHKSLAPHVHGLLTPSCHRVATPSCGHEVTRT
jgi:hypothetical protein